MMNKIYVLHENSTNSHFKALNTLLKNNNGSLYYYEFSLIRGGYLGFKKMSLSLIIKQFKNLFFLLSLIFTKNKKIILGIAPYDYRLIFIRRLLVHHQAYYFTSWHVWDFTFYPKKRFSKTSLVRAEWESFLENQIKGIFAVTETAKNNLNKSYKIKVPISVVYHSFTSAKSNNKCNTSFESKNNNCLFVGRFVEDKGVFDIIELAKILPNYNFTFVGQGNLNDYLNEISSILPNIKNLGYINSQKKLFSIYNQNNFLLLPSKKINNWEELFGMVIIEAMRCGLIPIASNHIGPKEIIQNGVNGFLVDEIKYKEKAKKIIETIQESDIKVISSNAIKRSKMFSDDSISEKWKLILN